MSLLEQLKQTPWLTASQLKNLGVAENDIKEALQNGLIKKQGEKRGTRYALPDASDFEKVEFVVENGTLEAAMDYVTEHKCVTSTAMATHLEIDKKLSYLALQQLVDEGKISKSGYKKGTTYHLHDYVAVKTVKEKTPRKTKSQITITEVTGTEVEVSELVEVEQSPD